MEQSRAQIDISPEHEAQVIERLAAWTVALQDTGLSAEDRKYLEIAVPKYQTELELIPIIRAGLERQHHRRAA